jgi:hypothetical protein
MSYRSQSLVKNFVLSERMKQKSLLGKPAERIFPFSFKSIGLANGVVGFDPFDYGLELFLFCNNKVIDLAPDRFIKCKG